ncbi:PqqD family peptide modification chaperone [Actinomyces qiguomingii]|uniref:PqqD family peptide modification chaperone n=1 Tax=Actinomyces qiguomingii TaxID=2057800 RepID=UPI000C9FFF9E|nr:PqqD family peptide modification chaperone [Actinomyces qiguomingii]
MYPRLNTQAILHRQPDAGYYYLLDSETSTERINRTGTDVLELCDGTRSIDTIYDIMAKRHNEGRRTVEALVLPFLAESAAKTTISISEKPQQEPSSPHQITGSYDSWIPLLSSFELTSSCNLSCIHCYASASLGNGIYPATEQVIDALAYLARHGTYSVLLTGGEPTMHPGFLEILEATTSLMRLLRVASNLYSVPEQALQALMRNDAATIQTSIDELRSTHELIRGGRDAFTRTMNNVTRLSQSGTLVIVAMTANRLNYREVEEVVQRCREAGAAAFRLGLTFPVGRAAQAGLALTDEEVRELQDDWDRIIAQYSSADFSLNRSEETGDFQELALTEGSLPSSCGAGHLIMHVNAKGDVNPCPLLDITLGNVYRHPMEEALSGPYFRLLEHAQSPGADACAECALAPMCGRCHAAAATWGKRKGCWWRSTPLAQVLSSAR